MKPKSALFISAALTAFVLAMLAGVVSALNASGIKDVVAVTNSTQQVLDTPIPVDPTEIQPTPVSPQEAASIAAQFLNQTDVYSVESSSFNGANAYLVTFSAGNLVYVGLDGQILSSSMLQPVVVNANPTQAVVKPAQGSSSLSSSGGGHEHEHEDEGGDD